MEEQRRMQEALANQDEMASKQRRQQDEEEGQAKREKARMLGEALRQEDAAKCKAKQEKEAQKKAKKKKEQEGKQPEPAPKSIEEPAQAASLPRKRRPPAEAAPHPSEGGNGAEAPPQPTDHEDLKAKEAKAPEDPTNPCMGDVGSHAMLHAADEEPHREQGTAEKTSDEQEITPPWSKKRGTQARSQPTATSQAPSTDTASGTATTSPGSRPLQRRGEESDTTSSSSSETPTPPHPGEPMWAFTCEVCGPDKLLRLTKGRHPPEACPWGHHTYPSWPRAAK